MKEINTNNTVVDIKNVIPNDYNPKLNIDDDQENRKEFEKIKESLELAGQIQPLIVRELESGKYEIINGYHRWRAMQELGYKKIEIKNLGKIDFDTAVSRALLTEDTKIPIDGIELSALIKKLVTPDKSIDYWASLLPYTSEVIQEKIDLINFDFNQFDNENEEVEDGAVNFNFKVSMENAEICRRALSMVSDDNNQAFFEVCESYIRFGSGQKNTDSAVEASQILEEDSEE